MTAPATTQRPKRARRCIACGAQSSKGDLLRIVRSPEGAVTFDATGKAAGRGAYVCSEACFEKACASKRLDRALKTKVSATDMERVRAEMRAATAHTQG